MGTFENLLIQTCTIQRSTTAVSATGEKIETYANLATNVPCLVQDAAKEMEVIDSGIKTPLTYIMFLLATEDIIENDKVIWESKTFLVKKAPPKDPSGLMHHREVKMEQL